MKVKLLLGQYAYLYHGNLDLQEINNFIKSLTQSLFQIKWKDQDEMITIVREFDLRKCIEYANQNKQSLRLFIQECPSNLYQQNQKQFQQQQNQQSILQQSNIQQIQSNVQYESEYPQLVKEQTFGARQSSDTVSHYPFVDQYEKQKYLQHTALTVMEEMYPGLQFDVDGVVEKKEKSQDIQQQFSQPIRKMESRQTTEKMTPQWNEKSQNDNQLQDFQNQETKPKLTLKLGDNSNSETIMSFQQNEQQEDNYFCDNCSEQIDNNENIYRCEQECQEDIHYCETCKNMEGIHDHNLVKL